VLHIARFSIRRPRIALAAWVLIAAVLALVGLGVSDRLSPSIVVVPGTESSRAVDLAESEFGPTVLVPILLQGPKAELDRQGPIVVRRLDVRTDTRVLSGFDGGSVRKQLRPSGDAVMIVASVSATEEEMVKTIQPQIDATVEQAISGPVTAHITGQPTIDRALQAEAVDRTRTAELLAIPILFLVLMLLLRAPLAAAVLAAFGGATALVGMGTMTLLGKAIEVDATAVALGSLTGLALGVGYSLTIYRRWQEDGVTDAVESSGRAILIGGTALVIALILATLIAPTPILTSLGIGVLLCSALAIGAAVVVMPAVLTLVGDRLQWLRFGLPRPIQRGWDRLAAGRPVIRHAAIAGPLATALLVLLALPALTLETGPPSATMLPKDSTARQDFAAVSKVMGPGWATPFSLVVASDRGPVTDRALIAEIDRVEKTIKADARVASVVGPGPIAGKADELQVLPEKLAESSKLLKGGKKELGKLESGLGQAGAGVNKLRTGLQSAASGAGQLQAGSGQAGGGAGQLHAGLETARSGAAQISGGLNKALAGARSLRNGAAAALAGSKDITNGLGTARTGVKDGLPVVGQMVDKIAAGYNGVQGALASSQALAGQLAAAVSQLQKMGVGKTDPAYQAALNAVSAASRSANGLSGSIAGTKDQIGSATLIAGGMQNSLQGLSSGLSQLYNGSGQLQSGIARLQAGNADLATGIGRLAGGGGQLSTGLAQLTAGAGQLEAGLDQLTNGAGALASGLSSGTGPAGQLATGLGTAESKVSAFRSDLPSPKDLEKLQKQSPGLFDSGYFVLAAIDGAPEAAQTQPSFVVNLDRGGTAAQIAVASKYAADDERTRELGNDLRDDLETFAANTATDGAVGGPAGELTDFASETQSRILLVVLGLAAAIALWLMLALRSVVLPLVAVAFDLLTAAAAFGLLTLLFGGDDPLLGGPGYIDPMSIIGIFAAVFGLTIVYQVMLIQRTRDELARTGNLHEALRAALRPTAYAATGAALVTLAAVGPFLATDLLAVRQFGVAIAAVVVLDAFIVRPVLLPAAIELLGRFHWPKLTSTPKPAV